MEKEVKDEVLPSKGQDAVDYKCEGGSNLADCGGKLSQKNSKFPPCSLYSKADS